MDRFVARLGGVPRRGLCCPARSSLALSCLRAALDDSKLGGPLGRPTAAPAIRQPRLRLRRRRGSLARTTTQQAADVVGESATSRRCSQLLIWQSWPQNSRTARRLTVGPGEGSSRQDLECVSSHCSSSSAGWALDLLGAFRERVETRRRKFSNWAGDVRAQRFETTVGDWWRGLGPSERVPRHDQSGSRRLLLIFAQQFIIKAPTCWSRRTDGREEGEVAS